MGVATLALCRFASSWSHTSARVTDLQPFTLVSVHSHHARHWSHHRISGGDCTASHDPTNRPYCLVRPRAAGPSVSCTHPHSASSLALSTRATFLCPATRPNCSIVSQQAACSAPRLPMSSFVRTPASINPSNRSPHPLRCRSCAGRGSSSATGHCFSGEAARSQAPVSGLRNHLLCPRRTVRHRPVLWAETRGGAIPK